MTKTQKLLDEFNTNYKNLVDAGYKPTDDLAKFHKRVNSGYARWNTKKLKANTKDKLADTFTYRGGVSAATHAKIKKMDKRARETISELQDKILPLFEEHGTVLALDEYKASPALERVLKNHEKGIYKESDLDVLKSKARIMKNIDRHSPENFIELPNFNYRYGSVVTLDSKNGEGSIDTLVKSTAYDDFKLGFDKVADREYKNLMKAINKLARGKLQAGSVLSQHFGEYLSWNKGLREKYVTFDKHGNPRVDFKKLVNLKREDFDETDTSLKSQTFDRLIRDMGDAAFMNTSVNPKYMPYAIGNADRARAATYMERIDFVEGEFSDELLDKIKDCFETILNHSAIFKLYFESGVIDSETSYDRLLDDGELINTAVRLDELYEDIQKVNPESVDSVNTFMDKVSSGYYNEEPDAQ